ncbi:guanylate kinase [Aaosphaeria arxii CBS 175.79]|uniref:Guanylate kinase n=1 Tax=Aaosphaeria arxii CBS 175.79 TaxID=1450172 RepID=A0A6A5Y0H2_9PLEO|nr:guanylate kinase [Aaosphaeria arxii CBS 175.79]KAF2018054.1 guanylate kinase [Aaosphaeria arxii CBS 175.79]
MPLTSSPSPSALRSHLFQSSTLLCKTPRNQFSILRNLTPIASSLVQPPHTPITATKFKTYKTPTTTLQHLSLLHTTTTTPKMAPTASSPTPIVISGPSGTGKSTILNRLFEEHPNKFGFSVSHTTRQPRGAEQHGKEYYFVTRDEFEDLIAKKGFVEHAQFGGNYYGTSIQAIEDIAKRGQICILDIEMEGVKQVANHPSFPRPKFLFLSPPSLEILEQRLRSRATDKEEAILKRLAQAKNEVAFAESGEAPHDKVVVNDDLEKAYQEVKEFIVGKEEK